MSESNADYERVFLAGQRVENTHLGRGTIFKDQRAHSKYDLIDVLMDGYVVPKQYLAGHLTVVQNDSSAEPNADEQEFEISLTATVRAHSPKHAAKILDRLLIDSPAVVGYVWIQKSSRSFL